MSESGEPVTRETPEPNRNQLAALRREVRQVRTMVGMISLALAVLSFTLVMYANWK